MNIDLIISINVHEKIDFLKRQLHNIKEHVKSNYLVIINPNKRMYELIKKDNFFNVEYIIINPNYFNKRTYHGSLLKGIYFNIKHICNDLNIKFKYFIVLSSRNFFYNELTLEKLDSITYFKNKFKIKDIVINQWHWSSFLKTKFSKYIMNNDMYFSGSAHEGLTFNYDSCFHIIDFFEDKEEIKNELFNWRKSIEEFVLQTIVCNYTDYFVIGNGVDTTPDDKIADLPNDRFVYKRLRI